MTETEIIERDRQLALYEKNINDIVNMFNGKKLSYAFAILEHAKRRLDKKAMIILASS